MPTQSDADEDRQLALYQIGLLQRWPDAKRVKLVWHYLAADKEIISSRTRPPISKSSSSEVVERIHQIEKETTLGRWEVRVSRLCDWCEYKPICPAFKHTIAMEALPVNEYLQDSGVQLVRKYAELDAKKSVHQLEIEAINAGAEEAR